MSDEIHPKLLELEQLLNDPDVPMQADRVWQLLADVADQGEQAHADGLSSDR